MSLAWLREDAEGVTLALHIQPGARTTSVCGLHGEALKIRLAAPPLDGRANEALIAFIAEKCGVPRSAVTLLSGASARQKRLRVAGVSAAAATAALA